MPAVLVTFLSPETQLQAFHPRTSLIRGVIFKDTEFIILEMHRLIFNDTQFVYLLHAKIVYGLITRPVGSLIRMIFTSLVASTKLINIELG